MGLRSVILLSMGGGWGAVPGTSPEDIEGDCIHLCGFSLSAWIGRSSCVVVDLEMQHNNFFNMLKTSETLLYLHAL